MIESYTKEYWLNELKESAKFLESLYRTNIWNNEHEFKTEKTLFLGFYAIRKLKESKLLSTRITGINTSLIYYSIKDNHKNVNSEKWSNKYYFGKSYKETLSLKKLCNQFIHSKIYSPFIPDNKCCVGFFFASDDEHKKLVYYVQLKKIVGIFLSIIHDK